MYSVSVAGCDGIATTVVLLDKCTEGYDLQSSVTLSTVHAVDFCRSQNNKKSHVACRLVSETSIDVKNTLNVAIIFLLMLDASMIDNFTIFLCSTMLIYLSPCVVTYVKSISKEVKRSRKSVTFFFFLINTRFNQ